MAEGTYVGYIHDLLDSEDMDEWIRSYVLRVVGKYRAEQTIPSSKLLDYVRQTGSNNRREQIKLELEDINTALSNELSEDNFLTIKRNIVI